MKIYTDVIGNPWIEIPGEYKGEEAIAVVRVDNIRLKVEGKKKDEPVAASGS